MIFYYGIPYNLGIMAFISLYLIYTAILRNKGPSKKLDSKSEVRVEVIVPPGYSVPYNQTISGFDISNFDPFELEELQLLIVSVLILIIWISILTSPNALASSNDAIILPY